MLFSSTVKPNTMQHATSNLLNGRHGTHAAPPLVSVRPFTRSRGRRGHLHVVAVAVKEAAAGRSPAILAGDGQSGSGHDSKKKVVIVGAGWAGTCMQACAEALALSPNTAHVAPTLAPHMPLSLMPSRRLQCFRSA